jgi:hypothetical protein
MTATFILILFAHVGPMGQGNSNAITVAEFYTKERCEFAGKAAQVMVRGTVKSVEFTCVSK